MTFNKKLWEEIAEFDEYIASDKWKKLREKRLKVDNSCCVICKSKVNLTCHHLTYERLYNEDINDLIILCTRCHNRMHQISPPKNQPEFTKQSARGDVFAPPMEDALKSYEELF